MVKLLADEHFRDEVIGGLAARRSPPDLVKARDVGLLSMPDEIVLAWAAQAERLVLTHDKKTLIPAANRRVATAASMPGVIFVPWTLGIGIAVTDLEFLLFGSPDAELFGRVHYLPLRI